MNSRQLAEIGVTLDLRPLAIEVIQKIHQGNIIPKKDIKALIKNIVDHPEGFVEHEVYGKLASAIIEDKNFVLHDPIPYKTYGAEYIDENAHVQMRNACSLPMAVAASLQADSHQGYFLPIGGVLALKNAVVPYAVGVDIACRMRLSVLDIDPKRIDTKTNLFKELLEKGTRFGIGSEWERPHEHSVMDADWGITKITREKKDIAWKQLGTSGSGNHFVEIGVLDVPEKVNVQCPNNPDSYINLEPGKYLAIMSHSGSRGAGAAVCRVYSDKARYQLPNKYKKFKEGAWLDLQSADGQEYWNAMNLMGEYASANHAIIHKNMAKLLGGTVIANIENHHNFAWKEELPDFGEVIVHRKGATPAGKGVLGVIPGSMAMPAHVVVGKGAIESINSASHGAGRVMSRKQANNTFNYNKIKKELEAKGIHILSAGADEVPGVYKNIEDVMAAQRDLVETIAQFQPRIVKMAGDGTNED